MELLKVFFFFKLNDFLKVITSGLILIKQNFNSHHNFVELKDSGLNR